MVVAHPDDESFALGALVDRWGRDGAEVSVLCLTRGEASTLGADAEDLSALRDAELRAAAAELGVANTTLLSHPDGALAGLQPDLEAAVERAMESHDPDGILVFDPLDGVTGHPDHRAASQAAISVAGRHGMPVLGWALPLPVSDLLRAEHGAAFAGYRPDDAGRGEGRSRASAARRGVPREPGGARFGAVATARAARRP